MKKIPTLFLRDPATNQKTLLRTVHPGCQWVLDGEGHATRKFDGAAILVRDGEVFKRRTIKGTLNAPPGFEMVQHDPATGKTVGWLPADFDDPTDRWLREAWRGANMDLPDGTYELCGPKIQGNPEGFDRPVLVPHGVDIALGVPRDYDGLKRFLPLFRHEGIVWHHPDGRMAKIKVRDFIQ